MIPSPNGVPSEGQATQVCAFGSEKHGSTTLLPIEQRHASLRELAAEPETQFPSTLLVMCSVGMRSPPSSGR